MTDEWGSDCEHSYHVPQLDADTTDAEYINECIQAGYAEPVALCKESIAQSIMPDIFSISWEAYQNGSVVSLVVKTVTYYSYYESYDLLNYDAKSGKQLLTKDILKLKSITDDTYWEAVRCAAVQYFGKDYFDTFTELAKATQLPT